MHCPSKPGSGAGRATSRGGFLSATARRGAALSLGATAAGSLVDRARAASGPLADLDLALARLAVAIELLGDDFYAAAIESKHFVGNEPRFLQRARFNEDEHLTAVSQILSGAGHVPSTADDFDFTFPARAFATRQSVAELGVVLETMAVGAYLGAVDAFTPPDLKTTAARIAASEAQHLSVWSRIAYGRPIGISFPAPLDYVSASAALDPYVT
jgi:Ferritin-like domain